MTTSNQQAPQQPATGCSYHYVSAVALGLASHRGSTSAMETAQLRSSSPLLVNDPKLHPMSEHESLRQQPSRPRVTRTKASRFSAHLSTEIINKAVNGQEKSYGPYADVRETLDYSYHSRYKKDRQWLQDSIVDTLMGSHLETSSTTPTEPWIIFTVGAMGVGKGHTIHTLVKDGQMPLLSYVSVDRYDIRARLPEFETYLEKVPENADRLTAKEASYIAEILALVALKKGKNVIFDCYLHDTSWYVEYFHMIREKYPSYKIAMIHVTAPTEMVLARASGRSLETGRLISKEVILKLVEHIPKSLDVLAPEVDYFCEIRNAEKLVLASDDSDWDRFQSNWLQTPKGQIVTNNEKMDASECACKVAPPRLKRKRGISVVKSSEENHKVDTLDFYGPFADIRATLDYNYHSNYSRERQRLQDRIISDCLDGAIIKDMNGMICDTPTEPFIVFTAGAMGAGKSYTINKLVEKGRFPLLAFVSVDPDEIRRHFPEFHLYVDHSPELAGELTRKEAGFVAEILTLAALRAGKNVMVDGSLRDCDWYQKYFSQLRSEFPYLRLAIIHVTAPKQAIYARAAARAVDTGRIVPRETLEAAIEQVPKSVAVLGPLVDYFVELNNAPGALDIEILTVGEDWDKFERTWLQTCKFVPSRRQFLKSSRVNQKKLAMGGKKVS